MKLEKINDSQIKCTLDLFDLNIRDLNLSELAYGSEKAKSLFNEMLVKARNELGFDTEDAPIMIEAVPTSPETLMLIITKMPDPEETDARFSNFGPYRGPLPMTGSGFATFEQLPVLDGSSEAIDQLGNAVTLPFRVFVFPDLDTVTDAAHHVSSASVTDSILYKGTADKKYYLLLDGKGQDPIAFASICNIMNEYASISPQNYSSQAYFKEHYEVIIAHDALGALAKM